MSLHARQCQWHVANHKCIGKDHRIENCRCSRHQKCGTWWSVSQPFSKCEGQKEEAKARCICWENEERVVDIGEEKRLEMRQGKLWMRHHSKLLRSFSKIVEQRMKNKRYISLTKIGKENQEIWNPYLSYQLDLVAPGNKHAWTISRSMCPDNPKSR